VRRRSSNGGCGRLSLVWAAALGAAALPALASAAVTATSAQAGPARPPESGAHDSAATLGPLAIGADVRDSAGADIGHVTRLTTDDQGRRIAQVRDGETVYAIPTEYLYARGGAAFSTITLDALKHGWKPD
jgi:hypothetical protein